MSQDSKSNALKRNPVVQDLIVTAAGFVASTATAWVLYAIESWWHFSIYSMTIWFVVPAGAMVAGMGAAAGYYAGARFADSRPTRLLLANMVLVSASTFFTIHWLRYDDYVGARLLGADVSFWRYLDFTLTHTSMTVRVSGAALGSTGELGPVGYLVAGLQILGFAAGGFLVYGALAKLPFCDRCARYLGSRGRQKRFADSAESFEAMAGSLVARWRQDDLQGVLDMHRGWGLAKLSKKCRVMSSLDHRQCSGCKVNWLHYRAQGFDGRNWKVLPGLDFSRYHHG